MHPPTPLTVGGGVLANFEKMACRGDLGFVCFQGGELAVGGGGDFSGGD